MKKKITESEINRIVKKIIKEEEEAFEPITIGLIKNSIKHHLENYDVFKDLNMSDPRTKLQLERDITNFAKSYYKRFIRMLDYMPEDNEYWDDFLSDIEY